MDIDGIKTLFENWKSVLNHPRSVLDKKRVKVLDERLKDGFTVEDLKLVPYGVKNSPWHMGQNPSETIYDSITLIYRSADQVDKFISLAEKKLNKQEIKKCQFCDWHRENPNVAPCDRHQPEKFKLFLENKNAKK